jgi:hypothetical protein
MAFVILQLLHPLEHRFCFDNEDDILDFYFPLIATTCLRWKPFGFNLNVFLFNLVT